MAEEIITNSTTPRDYFYTEYAAWKDACVGSSYPLFDNEHFRNIVAMGRPAVPYIINIIKQQPNHIVHALDLIIGEFANFRGYASLQTLCNAWVAVYDKIKDKMDEEYSNQ